MWEEFHKVDDGTVLWSEDNKYYYDNSCIPNIELVRNGNLLKDEEHNKIYEIVNGEFIYLRKDGSRYIEGEPYIWSKWLFKVLILRNIVWVYASNPY